MATLSEAGPEPSKSLLGSTLMTEGDALTAQLREVASWLEQSLEGNQRYWVAPAVGDVSARRYFRATNRFGHSLVVAWYPRALSEAYCAFVRSEALLRSVGIRTPEILALDSDHRFMALEDVGDRHLFEAASGAATTMVRYREALEIVGRLARVPPSGLAELNPILGLEVMKSELEQTWLLFLNFHLESEPGLAADLRSCLDILCARLGSRPPIPCHRDFMSRNLMIGPGGQLIVLDHQDLRLGPPRYDLASLLHDSRRLATAEAATLEGEALEAKEHEDYSRTVVQRMLKIVGTFCAFAKRGSPQYLPLIGPSVRSALLHLEGVPEGRTLVKPLGRVLGE